jgi:hypothetical protein
MKADAAGLQVGNAVLSTYIVDNYPEHAMEVITFYTVIINLCISQLKTSKFWLINLQMSALINPWFINDWVEASGTFCSGFAPIFNPADSQYTGYTWTFSAQAIICTFGILPTYFLLQKYGLRLRRPMNLGFADHIDP